MPDNDQNLSPQELQQLREIATTLPTGHPAQKKVSLLLNSQPTQFEQDRSGGKGFVGTLGDKAGAAWDAIAAGPTGGNYDPTTKDFWIGKGPQFNTPPMVQQALRPIPKDLPTGAIGGRGVYRAASVLSPLVPGLSPEGMESASAKGDTGGVAAETAIPTGLLAAGVLAPRAIPAIRGAARKALLDPVTGEPTVTPTSIAKRILRTPEEVGQANADKLESQMNDYQTGRQKELADMEQLKEQDAQSRMNRGREQNTIDAIYRREGKAVPLSQSPYAPQHAAAADFAAGKSGPFNLVSSSPNIADEAFNPGRSRSDTPFSSLPVQAIAGKPIPGANPDLWNPGIITPEQDAFLTSREALNAKIASNRGMEHAARGATAGRKPK